MINKIIIIIVSKKEIIYKHYINLFLTNYFSSYNFLNNLLESQ